MDCYRLQTYFLLSFLSVLGFLSDSLGIVWFLSFIPVVYTFCFSVHFQSVTVLLKAPFCHYLLNLLLSNMNILIGGIFIVNINNMVQINQQYPLWLTFVYYSILIWHFKGEESKEGCSLCYWNLNCFCFKKDSKPVVQLCIDEEYIATFTPQLWIEMSFLLASGCSFSELKCCPLLFNSKHSKYSRD